MSVFRISQLAIGNDQDIAKMLSYRVDTLMLKLVNTCDHIQDLNAVIS